MRRSRFAKAIDTGATDRRSSFREVLSFDVLPPQTSDDISLAAWRVAGFQNAPLLLGCTHLLIAAVTLYLHPHYLHGLSLDNPVLPLAAVLLLDLCAAVTVTLRYRWDLSPQSVVRLLCCYVAAVGMLWMHFGNTALPHWHDNQQLAVPLAMAGGFTVQAVVSVRSPALATMNLLVAAVGVLLFSNIPLMGSGVVALGVLLLLYSVADARSVLATGRKRLQLDAEARKALQFVDEFEHSGRGWFWETNAEGTLSYVSQQLADDFQCEAHELLGRQFNDLLSVDTGSGGALEERKTLGFHLSARFPFSDVIVRAASDEDIHWSLSGNPIFDDRGRFLGFRGIGTDLTEQRRSEQEITRLARFDSLTGLPNRAMMRQTLDEALRNASRRQKGCALFLIDLDRFKNVNDTLGHPIGDALLRQVADRLKSVMGDHGQVGRLGGDEFKAVLPGQVEIGFLESLARTLIEQVSRPYMIEGHRVMIGASVGIAIGDPGRSCADSLVRNADLALYAAKGAGRGKHCFFEPSMHSEASDRQVLENDLRQALDRNELWVSYQPIIHAGSEELSGFEALVRWNHPVRGPVSPAKFIPLAEECGLIGQIGSWVLQEAFHEAARWPDHVRIAVNLSPIQFNDPAIVQIIADALSSSGIRPARAELEITEGVFLSDSEMIDDTFARLKKLGVRLALDDFGTGYSSLGYLKKAPFDKIKIDQSFVRGAASPTSRNSAIIRAIVTLAESLKMDTCAEGVETHDDLNLIRELGCSQVQGFIFGKPAPAETAREIANQPTVEASGYSSTREPRQRLMRRAIAAIDGLPREIRLRNISAMGAMVECDRPVAPGTQMTIDIVGVGPVAGTVRWAQNERFGIQFTEPFNLQRLAPRKVKTNDVLTLRPWYLDQPAAGGA
jgi:diguanylate cyclase (GGDEF)-like protein